MSPILKNGYNKEVTIDIIEQRSIAMLYIATALYCEAKPFIRQYQLKKSEQFHKFQVFLSEDITLIITGVGEIKAAIAISSVCSICKPKEGDFFLSFGSCAALSKGLLIGELYLLHQLTQLSTKQTYYPDVLLAHPFQEVQGVTGSTIVTEEISQSMLTMNKPKKEACIYDMEGAASYISASYFFGTHQMAFIRLVSDYGVDEKEDINKPTPNQITNWIEEKADMLFSFIERIGENKYVNSSLEEEMNDFIEQMETFLHLSVTMKHTLQQHIRFYILMHDSFEPIVRWCDTNLPSECKSKKEGKIYFEELKRQLL